MWAARAKAVVNWAGTQLVCNWFSTLHRRPRTGMALEVDRCHPSGRPPCRWTLPGLQPMTAAGGRKNFYPGECRAFLQGTPVHFKVHGTGISSDAGCRPG